MVRIGIVGTGNTIGISKNHAMAYAKCDDAKITAVYDVLPGLGEQFLEKMGLTEAVSCASYEELLSLCDAVSICTPNCTHIDLTVQALKAGKHVLCEKPFAPTPEECDEAIRYAKLTGKVAMIGLCYRDYPGLRFLKKLVDDGTLGRIFFARQEQGGGRIADPNVKLEWRMQKDLSGPGALADFGSHMMDICDHILRRTCGRITQIQCMQGTYIPQREIIGKPGMLGKVTNDDVAVWNCRTESGTLYSFTASRIGAAFQLELVGEGGRAVYDGGRPFQLTLQLKDRNGGYRTPPQEVPVPAECYGPTGALVGKTAFEHPFYYEIRQFLDAIQEGKDTLLTVERGRYIQQLIQAAQDAADTGTVVDVPDFD